MHRIVTTILLFFVLFSTSAAEPTLSNLIAGLRESCPEYKQSEMELAGANARYKEGRAGLLPALSFSVPASLANASRTPVENLPVELEDSRQFGINPEISVSQYLPTAGTLGLSLSQNFEVSEIGGVTPESYLSGYTLDPTFTYTPSLRLSLTQPVVFAPVYKAAVTLIEENWAIARSNDTITRNMIIYKLCEAYHNLFYLYHNVVIAEERLETARDNYNEADKKFSLGQLARIMLLRADAELKKGQLDLHAAMGAYEQALDGFSRGYGADSESLNSFLAAEAFQVTTGALSLPEIPSDAEQVTEKAFKTNIELVIARKQLELARAGVIQVKAKEAPVLNLGTGFSFGAINNNYEELNDALAAPFGEDSSPAYFLELSLSGKMLDGGAGKSRIREAETGVRQNALRLEMKETEIRSGAALLLAKVERSLENLEYNRALRDIEEFEYYKGLQDIEKGMISRLDLAALKLKYDASVIACLQPELEYTLSRLEVLMFMGEDLEKLIQEDAKDA